MKKIIIIIVLVALVILGGIAASYLVARAKACSIAKPYEAIFLPGSPSVYPVLFLDDQRVYAWNFTYMVKGVAFPEDFPPSLLISWRGEVLHADRPFRMKPEDLPNMPSEGTR